MLWIHIDFNADPDTALYLNADLIRIRVQGTKPMRIRADPIPGQTFKSQKVELHEKYT